MDLSIVIPTRNRPAFLESLLSALQLQRRTEAVEIVVVDDCSTSEFIKQNENLCAQFKSIYVPLAMHSRQSITRNTGIRKAQGDWVAFLDDDVSVDPAWVSTAFSLIRNATSDIVGFEGKTIPSGDGLWDREVQNLNGELYLTTNIIFRRKTLEMVGGFDEELLGFCEDHELAVRMLLKGKIIFSDSLIVTHQPRPFRPVHLLKNAPGRIRNLLRSEKLFYQKYPSEYGKFRAAQDFSGTYYGVLFKHVLISLKRRSLRQLISKPIQFLILIIAMSVEQITAWTMIRELLSSKAIRKSPRNKNGQA